MSLRSTRERLLQAAAFETGGVAIVTPFYAAIFGEPLGESAVIMAALALCLVAWSPLHNAAFDALEWRLARRVASDRPQGLRIVHAVSHEATSLMATVPVLMALGGLGFWEALAFDAGTTLFYVAYAYVFHLAYDRLRPVRARRQSAAAPNWRR